MTTLATTTPIQRLKAKLGALRGNAFARNLASLGGAQVLIRISRLATTIALSRLLIPEQFGLAAVVLTVYELVALFTRNGIAAKVVQTAPEDLAVVANTAYNMTWVVCGALMIFQLIIAWPIAWAFNDTSIALPIAAMGIIYLVTPLCNIQAAFQQRENRVGRLAFAGAAQVISDNILTIVLAFFGFGMWAIILPKILVAPIWLFIVRSGHAWRPTPALSPSRFHGWRDIAKFSHRVMGVELLTTLQANMDNVLVGYFMGMHALGLYYFAFNGGLGITLGLITAAGVAVYPHLCAVRHDEAALRQRFIKTIRTMGMILVPMIVAQVLLAPFYVPIVFGEQWIEAIPVLIIICLSALARPFSNVVSQLLKAVGRPEIELRWQFATTLILGLGILIGCQFSIIGVAIAVFAVQTTMLAAFVYFAQKQVFQNFNNTTKVGVVS